MPKILIVDDDEIMRGILTKVLGQIGHEIIEAVDGDSCIELARKTKPDLIILDMSMPTMTGFDTAPILRTHPATKKVPILALTADTSTESIEAAHEAGCNHYMAKPFQSDKLLRTVERLIEKKA